MWFDICNQHLQFIIIKIDAIVNIKFRYLKELWLYNNIINANINKIKLIIVETYIFL